MSNYYLSLLSEDQNIGSALDQINIIKSKHPEIDFNKFKLACKNLMIGRKLMKKKNNEDVFTIMDIDWNPNATPRSMGHDQARTDQADEWQNDARSFSKLDDIKEKHGSELKDLDQPIIVAKLDNVGWFRLIPELCEPSFAA